MAKYRTIQTTIWNDPYIEDLNPTEKLLYIYLFSNPHVNNAGVMKVSLNKISYETGIKDLSAPMDRLVNDGKVFKHKEYFFVVNFVKHQTSTSPKIIQSIVAEFKDLPAEILDAIKSKYPILFEADEPDTLSAPDKYPTDTLSIPYGYPTNTLSIPYAEREMEREREYEEEIEKEEKKEKEKKEKKEPPVKANPQPKQAKVPPFKELITEYTDDPPLQEALEAWIEIRLQKKSKKPFTEKSLKYNLARLDKLTGGDTAHKRTLVENAVANSWDGFWPDKNREQQKNAIGAVVKQVPPDYKPKLMTSEDIAKLAAGLPL